jgi:hypothetical protein
MLDFIPYESCRQSLWLEADLRSAEVCVAKY